MKPAPTVHVSPSSYFTDPEVLRLCSGQCESRVGPTAPGLQLDSRHCMYLDFHWTEKRPSRWLLFWGFSFSSFLAGGFRGLSNTVNYLARTLKCGSPCVIKTRQMKWCVVRNVPHASSFTVCDWRGERNLQISGLFALIFMFSRDHIGKNDTEEDVFDTPHRVLYIVKNASFLSSDYVNYFRGVHSCHCLYLHLYLLKQKDFIL